MKKLFWAIYFISLFFIGSTAYSATREIINPEEYNKIKSGQTVPHNTVAEAKDDVPASREEFIRYIRERAKKAAVTKIDTLEGNTGLSVVHSNEYIAQQVQDGKSTFQKMYEEALNKVGWNERAAREDISSQEASLAPSEGKLRSEVALQKVQKTAPEFNFDIINITLPNGKMVEAPAKEHIPYLSSKIEIMPDGLVRIRETIVVVANGEKLKYGLIKALPKYSISRKGERNSTIPYLNGVRVNGTYVEYVLKDNFDRFLIMPKHRFQLQSGIYTYEFDYVLDRKLWYYDEFNEFYWDVTGSFWNLAITNAIATVRLPINVAPLGETLMVGYLPNDITEEGTVITYNKRKGIMGFASEYPMFAGEGMFMLIRIPKKGFTDPDFNKKFKWFTEDYGGVLFAFLGFCLIFAAYYISWKNMDKSAKDGAKIKFAKTPMLNRLLAKGVYDKISFGAFLLEMFRRGFLNIIRNEKGIMLIKRNNDLHGLNAYMRKALNVLFPKKETMLFMSYAVSARLNEASKAVRSGTLWSLKMRVLKLNIGYILLSFIMLFGIEAAISYLSVSMWTTFKILIKITIFMGLCFSVFAVNISNKYLSFVLRILAVGGLIVAGLNMYNHIHLISVVLIMATEYVIFLFSRIFSKPDGLIRYNVCEAKELAQKLKDDEDRVILNHKFAASQPDIFALDASDYYSRTIQNDLFYRLDLVKEIIKFM